jgi:PAS domain S-box-containing protein
VSTGNPTSSTHLASAFLRWFEELSDRGIFTTDEALVVRTWNPWLETHTGIRAAAAIGRPLFDVLPSLRERGLNNYYEDALEGEVRVLSERLHKFLIPVTRGSSAYGVIEMAQSARVAPLSADNTVIGTITVIEDVTERVVSERELRSQIAASERARAAAEDASRLKDEFLATLSHEIRTPLNAVLGWARILRTQGPVKSREHALEVIERNATAQLRLVEDLLDMARVISGKLRLDIQVVAMEDAVTAAIDGIEPAAVAKQIDIHTDFAKELPPVNADFDRLQQAVWNLMSNAVKFTDNGGRIDVRLEPTEGGIRLTVSDTGLGIEHDFLPFVFDRFRQADASASRRHGGLGLGLALVRQIAELHGGTVAVDSPGKNRGATFTLLLPAANVAPRAVRRSATAPTMVTLKGVTVLLVDDSDDGREMLATGLRDFGARVDAVASADGALRLLTEDRFTPDVMVSDIAMPGMDGYELIRRIRTSGALGTRHLPAIAVTAYANPEDRIRALTAGYQLHIAKPADAAAVASAIVSLVTT